MASPSDALAPLGMTPPQRSTRAEATERRPAALYPSLLATLYARGQVVAPGPGCRFKNPLFSRDSTTSSRYLNHFHWARDRTAKGALKVHTRLDQAGYLPGFVVITKGQRRALAMARGLPRPRGSLVAMDRGDSDDRCLVRLTSDTVYCVLRQKINATCTVTARFAVHGYQGMTSDQPIVLRGHNGHGFPAMLRRVGSRAPKTGQHDVCWPHAF